MLDAIFLRQVTVRRIHRVARAAGNLTWVATQSEISTQRDGKPVVLRSTETMVVRRTAAGMIWQIAIRTTDLGPEFKV